MRGPEAANGMFGERAAMHSVVLGDLEATVMKKNMVEAQIAQQAQGVPGTGLAAAPTPAFANQKLEQDWRAYLASPVRPPPIQDRLATPSPSGPFPQGNAEGFPNVARQLFPRPNVARQLFPRSDVARQLFPRRDGEPGIFGPRT